MRRMIVAAVIFVLIITLWFLEVGIIKGLCGDVLEKTAAIERAIENGEDTSLPGRDFFNLWGRAEKTFDILTPHDETDEITILTIRLQSNLDNGDNVSARLTLHEIEEHTREIERKSRVSLTTVF